jgi:hypothetical protein
LEATKGDERRRPTKTEKTTTKETTEAKRSRENESESRKEAGKNILLNFFLWGLRGKSLLLCSIN